MEVYREVTPPEYEPIIIKLEDDEEKEFMLHMALLAYSHSSIEEVRNFARRIERKLKDV